MSVLAALSVETFDLKLSIWRIRIGLRKSDNQILASYVTVQ